MNPLLIFAIFGTLIPLCFGSTIIETKLGKVEGFLSKSANGNDFLNFMGIPFAKPPIGQLRFKKPEPVEPWSGTLQAKETVVCLQDDALFLKTALGQEDCLVLNVYVPGNGDQKRSDLLPVMVFIHGGAFFLGSGSKDFYGPDRILDYDVVLVTINYRLGPLGFMSTSNDDMPANLGLWDQNLALKWVQNHIKDFGGNPDQVTIFGESAGAMSVLYHYLSPQSKGLFHRAIAQSGSATSSFLKVDKNPIYYARSLAEKVGCDPKAETKELVDCLREVDALKIQQNTFLYPQMEWYPIIFKPYVDDFSQDPFIPKDPWDIINSGEFNDVPLIIGNNKDEGLISASNFHEDPSMVEELIKRWDNELGPLYITGREADEIDSEVLELAKEVSKFAFPKDGKPSKDTILTGFKDLVSDTLFNAIGTVTARKIAEKSKSNVYEYLYTHNQSVSLSVMMFLKPWQIFLKYLAQFVSVNLYSSGLGVAHGDELFMFFKFHSIPIEGVFTEEDKATSKNMLKLWTDFAKTGNPTPNSTSKQWTKLSSTNKERLEIGSGTLEMTLDAQLEERVDFWSKIWSKMPTVQHLKTSRTWTNDMLYGPTNIRKEIHREAKEEL